MADFEAKLLETLNAKGRIDDTWKYTEDVGVAHSSIVGSIKSLEAHELIAVKNINNQKAVPTKEAKAILESGASPEVQVIDLIPADGLPLKAIKEKLGEPGEIGYRQAMAQRWVKLEKSGGAPLVFRQVESVEDKVLQQLQRLDQGEVLSKPEVDALKKRKLVTIQTWVSYQVTKGAKFQLQKKKQATELTADMIQKGTWRDQDFKPYNFNALGLPPSGGHLHPLLKVRTQFRKIFMQMGFQEMPTNNYVESSFWNFDALFQPQQHPARDAHDTFFVTYPATTPLSRMPADYVERVQSTHERGEYGDGSLGYGSPWKHSEAEKNLLRTHTTAVSSRMLYRLAQSGFKPAKYFSIDRVFRNEAIDRTHLAEFHQIEGLICDKGVTLGDLIGTLKIFYGRLGLHQLRFKPAFNPYTEPSMEIFGFSEELGKWMELGNSGIFRPEMLRPMGLPADVSVIAFGLGLERPTMILYGIDNIRDLFGHKVSLSMVKKNAICRLGL